MTFLRPEALAAVLRWREAAIGLGAAALGLWWAVGESGLMRWVGVAFVLGGIAILREGFARARRPSDGTGAGVVEIDERQITYLSADGGGAVSLEALERVEVARKPGAADAAPRWIFTSRDGAQLGIPGDAVGAALIFDAIAVLPGVSHEGALSAARETGRSRTTIWERRPAPPRPRLH